MVFLDSSIDIYVDFLPITTTTSPEEALSLLISMYTIFELNFPKNNRTIRLLYAVLHGETRFLSNTIRHFIKKKPIDIVEVHRQNVSNTSLARKNESQLPQPLTSGEKSDQSNDVRSPTTVLQTTCNSPVQSAAPENQ